MWKTVSASHGELSDLTRGQDVFYPDGPWRMEQHSAFKVTFCPRFGCRWKRKRQKDGRPMKSELCAEWLLLKPEASKTL